MDEADPPDVLQRMRRLAARAEQSCLGLPHLTDGDSGRSDSRPGDKVATDEEGVPSRLTAVQSDLDVIMQLVKQVQAAHTVDLMPCSAEFGHSITKLMLKMEMNMLVVSTPERGTLHGGAPYDAVEVMTTIERTINHVFKEHGRARVLGSYDFKDSAMGKDLARKEEASGVKDVDWSKDEDIMRTHWSAYWAGGVVKALQTMLLTAAPLASMTRVNHERGIWEFARGSRHVMAASISGGNITQAEKRKLNELINAVVSDVSTREIDSGQIQVYWLHFETVDDFLKALQVRCLSLFFCASSFLGLGV